jgi:hypothetical protein
MAYNNWANIWGDIWGPIWSGSATDGVTLTGTAIPVISEAQVFAGGKTIIINLSEDTWVAAGATFDAQRQAIINGLDSDQSYATGWNAEVRDNMAVTAVVRTSDTIVTITLPVSAVYAIDGGETVTVTVPASALTGGVSAIATPTIGITPTLTYGASSKRRGLSLGMRVGM